MTCCLILWRVSWTIVLPLLVATSMATEDDNKLYTPSTICQKGEPIEIPIDEIQKELEKHCEIEKYMKYIELRTQPGASFKYFYIDILAIADYSIYQQFMKVFKNDVMVKSEIRKHLAFFIFEAKKIYLLEENGFSMQDLYDFKIVINLVDVIIFERSSESFLYGIREGRNMNQVDAKRGLKRLTAFAEKRNSGSFDHISIFTSYELTQIDKEGVKDRTALGLAWMRTTCRDHQSASIIEDGFTALTSVVFAHELGHSLGADHDGEHNNCSSEDNYLMSPVISVKSTSSENYKSKWRFSECSKKAIASYISKQIENDNIIFGLGGGYLGRCDCFQNRIPTHTSVPDVSKRFHGSEMNLASLCKLKGLKRPCEDQNKITQPCIARYCGSFRKFHCERLVPYRGTRCGEGKVCEMGVCRVAEELKKEKINFSSNLTAPCGTHCLHGYGWNLIVVTFLVCGTLTE